MSRTTTSPASFRQIAWITFVAAVAQLVLPLRAFTADEAFYRISLRDLKIVDGQWPDAKKPEGDRFDWSAVQAMEPRIHLDGAQAEAFIGHAGGAWNAFDWQQNGGKDLVMVARAPAGAPLAGLLLLPGNDYKKMVAVRFTAPDAKPDAGQQTAFYRAKYQHYDNLAGRGAPGAAWFRYQARQAYAKLDNATTRSFEDNGFRFNAGASTLDETYNLISGGRALSENLQLDRLIPAGRRVEELKIDIDAIEGVKTKELDWAPLIKGKQPATDPLADCIPANQHAVFFPSFAALRTLTDEADTNGVPVLQALDPQAADARVKERYQRQLCLPFTLIGKLLGPQLIDSVAITGSDAYLRVGSDVAVLFAAKDAASLKAALAAQLNMARQREPGAQAVNGKVGGVAYAGVVTPDRAVCAYLAQLQGNVIVMTNSLKQLERLAGTRDSFKPLSKTPEYTFFRDRYPRGGDESAFVVLTDATIRRWCSARWRILDSRRTLAAAVMADLQAQHLDELVARKGESAPIKTDRHVPEMGELKLTATGVTSSTYGSLDFMTPIVELQSVKATEEESQLYARWREGYERNWSTFFDPIAVRLDVSSGKLSADVTIMPLIAGSQYNTFISLVNGAKLTPSSGDPHHALIHYAMAINRESEPMKEAANLIRGQMPQGLADPFGWVGKAISLYVDDDPFWQEAAKAEDPERFVQKNFDRLPIAFYIANESPLRLAAFIAAARTYIDGSAPNLTAWDTLEYNGISYVRVSGKGEGDAGKFKVYYVTTPEALVITLNEAVLKRALDRYTARQAAKKAKADGAAPPPEAPAAKEKPHEWLGESVAMEMDARAIALFRGLLGRSYQQHMRELSFSNLPILNEWKRLFPDEDPVKLHQRLWQVRLVDPAGGQYVWNEQYQTMESTAYGHPAAPKDGPSLPAQLDKVTRAAMGVTFENQGLRARAVLEREARK